MTRKRSTVLPPAIVAELPTPIPAPEPIGFGPAPDPDLREVTPTEPAPPMPDDTASQTPWKKRVDRVTEARDELTLRAGLFQSALVSADTLTDSTVELIATLEGLEALAKTAADAATVYKMILHEVANVECQEHHQDLRDIRDTLTHARMLQTTKANASAAAPAN